MNINEYDQEKTYPMTAPAKLKYSSQLSEFQLVEQGLEGDLGLGVETVVAGQTVVRRERQDDLRGTGDKV